MAELPRRVLHQFPISHYCEKTRWHLDRKRLPYEVRNLVPGVHRVVNQRLVGKASVPVLVDGDRAIADSTDIAIYLDEKYDGASLIPKDGPARHRVLELESFFDDGLGPAIRRWMYGQAMRTPGLVPALFFNQYGRAAQVLGRVVGGLLQRELRRMYRIDGAGIADSERAIREAAARIEEVTDGNPDRYLAGDALSLADVTAAALFAPLIAPAASPWGGQPPAEPIVKFRDELRARPAGAWVLARYERDRRTAAG